MGVVASAVTGLIVDTLFLREGLTPDAALADAGGAQGVGDGGEPGAGGDGSVAGGDRGADASAVAMLTIARQLSLLSPAGSGGASGLGGAAGGRALGDGFALPASWAALTHPVRPEAAPARPVEPAGAPAWGPAPKLTAVMLGGGPQGQPRAMVDGKLLRVGESHAGLTLVEVHARSAVFEGSGRRVEVGLSVEGREDR